MERTFSETGRAINLPDTLLALAEEFGSGMMDADELLYLSAALAAFSWNAEAIVVEIGAYIGRTTAFIAKVLQLLGKRVPILSIDAFERVHPDAFNPQGQYATYLETIRANQCEDVCLSLSAFSQDAAPVVAEKIGVLVVDGGHSYLVVKQDLALYGVKVLPGGFIFIDDYSPVYPDVIHAVDEYFVPGCSFTIVHKSYFVVAQRNMSTA